MKKKSSIKLTLTEAEKKLLRGKKFTIADLYHLAIDEIEGVLEVPHERAKELYALIEFQTVHSIGIRFAEDLIFLGYYSLEELKNKDGARLVEAYERKKGYWIDPCVEDQFRLVVHVANNRGSTKRWWDFTAERKAYREEHGYPTDRPQNPWMDMVISK